ncbi:MAG: hypothetical protein A2161_01200 [Candidatus Schekmanbacteria bacterium RBG_13_48_7]|uniref:Guanylate cyclase domain-containing protein n=1 Tax=Candidatus Schekmanbacteria bacterium RBG_13_48_7 TaxID=1817878 RepID=A0A1F7RN97_9BACT|nr:MAG: hypothetical protein A2161_01200 [Candidatus Schekmanbacteria bacterium RBG_13_48_7]
MTQSDARKKRQKKIFTALLFPFIITAILFALAAFDLTHRLFLRSEDYFYSSRFYYRGIWYPTESRTALVAVTHQALQELGEFGIWPRSYHAEVIDRLVRADAKLIVFDIIFSTEKEHDEDLANAIKNARGRVILACEHLHQVMGKNAVVSTMELPLKMFTDAGAELGIVNLIGDDFGTINDYIPYIFSDRIYPTLGLKAALKYLNINTVPEDFLTQNNYLNFKNIRIPLNPGNGEIPINHMGPAGRIPTYSYEQILSEKGFNILLDKKVLKDKIIFIGATDPSLQDTYRTAYSTFYDGQETPGVEIHAQLAESILNRNFLRYSPRYTGAIIVFLCSLITSLLIFRFGPYRSALFASGFLVIFLIGGHLIFNYKSIIIPMFMPMLAVAVTYLVESVYFYLIEQKEKKIIRGYFQHYLTKSLVDELIKNPSLVKLGGEKRVMTALFSDIAGFTTISESMKVEELVILLNEYLSEMTGIVLAHEGLLDKYEGDAIMAEFGAPIQREDHALRGCLTAIEMQKKLVSLREKWIQEGKPEIYVRIGINTGEMVVGNMGSRERFDYTVIGDHVNLASRLEGANKQYQTSIMISEFTYEHVKNQVLARELDLIRVKGKKQAVKIYELICHLDDPLCIDKKKIIDEFHSGLHSYKNKNWTEAEKKFRNVLESDSNDGPSKIYLDRCRMFRMSPPPEDWDGIFSMKTK